MRAYKPGDILYSFLGEKLVEFKMIAYLNDDVIIGETDDGNLTLFEKFCYSKRHNAIVGMHIYLKSLESES